MARGRVSGWKVAGALVLVGGVGLLCASVVSTVSGQEFDGASEIDSPPGTAKDLENLKLEVARFGEDFDQIRLTRGEKENYAAMKWNRLKMRKQAAVAGVGIAGLAGSLYFGDRLYKIRRRKPKDRPRITPLIFALFLSVVLLVNGVVHSIKAARSSAKTNKHRNKLLVELLQRYAKNKPEEC